jgi:VWFA-related protein
MTAALLGIFGCIVFAASRPLMKTDVRMVLVPVTVTDSSDCPVADLPKSSFKVFEDNVEQNVVSLLKEDGPVSVGFIVDTSGSMTDRMEPSIAAIEQFLNTTIPGDEYFLLRFSTSSEMAVEFTEDPRRISAALRSLRVEGYTSLNDAIYRGVDAMKRAKNRRKALFVVTDGGDNNSRYSDSEVHRLVEESDVRVYAIGLFARPDFLIRLGRDSGGFAFWVHRMADLPDTVAKLSRDFRNEYLLGYSPTNQASDGRYRRIRVRLAREKQDSPLHLSWRRGYYAPD